MAVYKVIQDIEAEDKLLGPLGLKGLIYAAIVAALGFLNFRLLFASGLGPFRYMLIFIFFLPMILFAVLASPLGRDQPTEVWVLSRVRFLFKPHRRIWNQSGIKNLVTITAPKRIEKHLTKEFSQSEVRSRLEALAATLDSRGWAVKNINVNLNLPTAYELQDSGTDRLVDGSSVKQAVPDIDVRAADDILDEKNNPTAQNFQNLIVQADNERKQAVLDKINTAREDSEPKGHNHAEKIHDIRAETLLRAGSSLKDRLKEKPGKDAAQTDTSVTAAKQAAKLELAQSGNDLSVASIAQLANRAGAGEVVINLH